MTTKAIAAALTRCVAAAADSAKGYALAGANARDPELRAFLFGISTERATFATTLGERLAALGIRAERGSKLAVLHRIAVDVRLAVQGRSDEIVLEECERGEREAQRICASTRMKLSQGSVPREIRDLVDEELAAVLEARVEIRRRLGSVTSPAIPV